MKMNRLLSPLAVLLHRNQAREGCVPPQPILFNPNVGRRWNAALPLAQRFSALACSWVAMALSVCSVSAEDPKNPLAGLIQSADGALYGTTSLGGDGGFGTVFRVNTDGTSFTVLKSFAGWDGSYPEAALVQDAAGTPPSRIEGGTDMEVRSPGVCGSFSQGSRFITALPVDWLVRTIK